MRRDRPKLTYANVMSTIAVFAALGGSAWAASKIGTKQIEAGAVTAKKLHKNAVTTKKIKDDAVTGAKADEASFGPVPDSARLDGKPASDYRLHCPGDLDRAGDLCYEVDLRDSDSYRAALKKCALDQRRLPSDGELAQVFDHLGALQSQQWVAGHFRVSNGGQDLATTLGSGMNRDLTFDVLDAGSAIAFRCVTSATN
ncbi:MAG TPA: hypothetical protein VFS73_01975 [Solirubrobacterales bacterium]|jgi:hypothetical protein|nr:hypothetical protein [Solirubrobacterales bacterium]